MVYEYTLYRVMSRDEYRVLEGEGFAATFRRRWKFFTMDAVYAAVLLREFDYGGLRGEYRVPVEFRIVSSVPLEMLVDLGVARVYPERGCRTVALSLSALGFFERVEWRRLGVDELPEPEPLLAWLSKRGRVRMVYRRDKALRILASLKPERIIYVSPSVIDGRVCR